MFGYIGCAKEQLSEEEQKRYQSIYCGLCRNLKERYGQVERLCLSYDMAFLILLLSSLYEPEEKSGRFRCSVHPLSGKEEGKHLQRWYAGMLEKKCGELKKQYPRQWKAVAERTAGLEEVEKKAARDFDRAINSPGGHQSGEDH